MRAFTRPIRIRNGEVDKTLRKLSLGDLGYSESWLQELIAAHPEVLPVAEIEPAFEHLIPSGREIACGHGYIDNLFLTGGGDIVVVETKLHANSQARREVVAQTLDYVAALSAMSFDQFEAAVCAAQHVGERPNSLHWLVKNAPEALDECAFADAISANLARGRMLALVVGDGIRREAETLAGVLQSHAGSHFTFALVELTIFRSADGDLLVVPSTLAKTLLIERAVVRVDPANGPVVVEPLRQTVAAASVRPRSLTEIEFDEIMDQRGVGLAEYIRAFVRSLEPLGVYPELRGSLNLKAEVGGEKPVNLGYIQKNGQLWTDAVSWKMPLDPALEYLTEVANLIGGSVVQPNKSPYVAASATTAPRIEDLLPQHEVGWRAAIEKVLHRLRSETAES